uniref:GIY-YIG nuclease family protein n=1 Tax=Rheinheimera sp. TaxID=1869214 RepID=UPI00404836C9
MGAGLEKYKFTDEMYQALTANFCLVAESVNLDEISRDEIDYRIRESLTNELSDITGVYFWTMNLHKVRYKIYAGKTKSLKRRLSDYINPFQIHSPNDYKLKFFQNFIFRNFPEATFDLYFMPCDLHSYTQHETETVKHFCPLVNERAQLSQEAKNKMKQAFAEYYDSVFAEKIY